MKPATEANATETKERLDRIQQFGRAFHAVFEEKRLGQKPSTPIESLSLEEAYAVQQLVVETRIAAGEQAAGYKVGCTSREIRRQFGLDEPICGRVMHPHVYQGNATLNWNEFYHPAVEPEFVLMIGQDLSDEVAEDEPLDHAVAYVSPGIEIHNYHWWFGRPTLQELIASNGIHACLVVGDQKLRPKHFDWDMEGVGLFRNGHLAVSGIGAEIMGGPMKALRWLVNHLATRGDVLRAGQLVIPGSPVKLITVEPGDRVCARFAHIGEVEVTFRESAERGE